MGKYVVAVAVDKVQKFLYETIHARTKETQKDKETLRRIIGASWLISEQLYQEIGLSVGDAGAFSGDVDEVLLECSGVCIFTTSLAPKSIKVKLERLFLRYYQNFNGNLLLKYVYFEAPSSTDQERMTTINRGKKKLKKSLCANQMMAMNKEALFQFQKFSPAIYNVGKDVKDDDMDIFAETLDDLLVKQEDAPPGASETYFRIAVVKCDLDGMGELFKAIKVYGQYGKLSKILSEHVSMRALANLVGESKKKYSEFQLYPFYAAGDDLFFAVPVSQLLQAMQLCERLLKNINAEIEQAIPNRDFSLLSLSVGIDFAINHEPIRYYYARAEAQLSAAKQAKTNNIPAGAKNLMRIGMNNYVLYQFEIKKEKEKKIQVPYWPHFLHTVKLLKGLEAEGFATHHFLYGLLAKITDPQMQGEGNEVRFSNAVLYHLLPQYINGSQQLRERELRLLEALFAPLTVKKEKQEKQEEQHELDFDKGQRKNLEQYVRLLLLFSDTRFQISQQLGALANEKFDSTRIRRSIFNRVLRYVYEKNLLNGKDDQEGALRSIFAEDVEYQPEKTNKPVKIYRIMRLSSSLFYRMKQISDIQMIANMLLAANADAYGEAEEELVQETHERSGKESALTAPPPRLSFTEETKKGFVAVAKSCWSNDYIDSLLIFYRFNELSIRYKTIYSAKNTAKVGKQHGKHRV